MSEESKKQGSRAAELKDLAHIRRAKATRWIQFFEKVVVTTHVKSTLIVSHVRRSLSAASIISFDALFLATSPECIDELSVFQAFEANAQHPQHEVDTLSR